MSMNACFSSSKAHIFQLTWKLFGYLSRWRFGWANNSVVGQGYSC